MIEQRTRNGQRGDTIIEVLLAITILSVVVIGAISMMTRGHAIALDSLERSQVTSLMTEQSEMLQYIRDSYASSTATPVSGNAALWQDIVDNWTAGVVTAGCYANARAFYLEKTIAGTGEVTVAIADFDETTINQSSANFVETYARPGDGMWIEAEMPPAGAGGIPYIDFHIKGCWQSVGQGPLQESKTIVRLYAPAEGV